MITDSKRRSGLRLKRLLFDEWAMIALLTAGLVQTGFAVSAMNGVVRSSEAVALAPVAAQSLTTQTPALDINSTKNALAAVTPQKHRAAAF